MFNIKNLFKKLKTEEIIEDELEELEEYGEDFYDMDLEEKDKQYNFPILRSKAIEIADRDENLKTDFYRRYRGNITYLRFSKKEMDVIELNGKKYWQIQILDGDISGVDYDRKYGITDWDGGFSDKDLKKLRCLIDDETGEYIYYPNKKFKLKTGEK